MRVQSRFSNLLKLAEFRIAESGFHWVGHEQGRHREYLAQHAAAAPHESVAFLQNKAIEQGEPCTALTVFTITTVTLVVNLFLTICLQQ